MSDKKTITLTVRGTDITFAPTTEAYNRYINELMPLLLQGYDDAQLEALAEALAHWRTREEPR